MAYREYGMCPCGALLVDHWRGMERGVPLTLEHDRRIWFRLPANGWEQLSDGGTITIAVVGSNVKVVV